MSDQGLWQIYPINFKGERIADLLANKQRAAREALGLDAGFPFTGGTIEAYHFESQLRGDSENGNCGPRS